MADKIDDAIAGAPQVQITQLAVNINSPGRQVMLALPTDLTAGELLEFVSWLTNSVDGLLPTLQPRSPLVIARGAIPRPS